MSESREAIVSSSANRSRRQLRRRGVKGSPSSNHSSVAVSDFITAEQRVRQLEADRATLLVRKARLEAQRDGRENFVMPVLVGFNRRNVDFDRAYSAENDTFLRLADTYRTQIEALQKQRPRIEAETNAVTDQIAKQKERLGIVTSRLADLELIFGKGLLRKEVLINQRIEKALVEAQLSTLEAQVAHLGQTMGELDVKLGDLKATFERQTLERAAGNLPAPARDRDQHWSGAQDTGRKGRSRKR